MNARDLVLDLLQRRFGPLPRAAPIHGLADFQQEARQRLDVMLERHGGALLADSVGLGKTHIAAAIARDCADRGVRTVAVVPTSLQRMWHRALAGVDSVVVTTHARLSRGVLPALDGDRFVIVDEAHAFRNPATRRYAALARIAHGNRLLLLSATPVNNSLWDLYWLLRLFVHDGSFARCGVPDLFACIDAAERSGRPGRLPAVLAEVALRRTRAVIRELYPDAHLAGASLSFPRREPPRPIRYEIPPDLLHLLRRLVRRLSFAPWRLGAPPATIALMRLGLLKRFESSTHAFAASLRQLDASLRDFTDGLAAGRVLAPRRTAALHEDRLQLSLLPLLGRPLTPAIDAVALARAAHADRRLLAQALRRLDAHAEPDPKLLRLSELLLNELRDRPVLLFTEYRATAEYLHARLHRHVPAALIHGTGALLGSSAATRRAIVERFAPRANQARDPPPAHRVRLLIATDVLAEGLNLQDAADVISYDLPWNPMRIVQRLGRVDRLGSLHPSVRGWYFAPQRGLESLLGLESRLRRKLRRTRAAIGLDAPVLAARRHGRNGEVLQLIAEGRGEALERVEQADANLFTAEERLRAAFRRALAPHSLAGLPLAADTPAATVPHRPRQASRANGVSCVALRYPHSPRAALACVVFQLEGVQRAVFVARRGAFEDDVAFSQLLLHCLEADVHVNVEASDPTLIRRALRALRSAAQHAPHRVRSQPLSARLLRLLQDTPGGATAAECARVERVLARLAGGLLPHQRLALKRLERSPGSPPLDALLDAVETVLEGPPQGAPAHTRRAPRRPVAIAVFRLLAPLTGTPDSAILTGSKD